MVHKELRLPEKKIKILIMLKLITQFQSTSNKFKLIITMLELHLLKYTTQFQFTSYKFELIRIVVMGCGLIYHNGIYEIFENSFEELFCFLLLRMSSFVMNFSIGLCSDF